MMQSVRSKVCPKKYSGGSARPATYRVNEHESSTRLLNDRSTLGQHAQTHSSEAGVKGKRDYDKFFDKFNFKIVATCRDTLETFITEGLHILKDKPEINNMSTNGFVEY